MNQQIAKRVISAPGDFAVQSTPRHVAIIMDGNRRWASQRGMPATAGHRAGARRLEELLPAVRQTDIQVLTVFAFASANWKRSELEVSHLLRLAHKYLDRFTPRCVAEGLRLEVIGRRDRLPAYLLQGIELAERATVEGTRTLRIALDYSSRESILAAARRFGEDVDPARIDSLLGAAGDVDLLIRTGCEQRLSDFLLWECAFAELYFPDVYWPDFDAAQLTGALEWFGERCRRYGR